MQIEQGFLISKLSRNKTASFEFQQRRHLDWTENYQLYRDKVIINRLTQRQSVNVPLGKQTVRSILSNVDDAPDLSYEDKGNDKQKEIFLNEYWKYTVDCTKLNLKDIVDKKQVLLYGRTFKKISAVNGEPYIEILEPFDVLVDRYADPADLDTAQHQIHLHIYRTLGQLSSNPLYDQSVVSSLKMNYATQAGLIRAAENVQSMTAKNERLSSMGVPDINNPQIGEVYVELNEHYVKLWDETLKRAVIHVITVADGMILMDKPLDQVLGKTKSNYWQSHFPIISWADDLERADIWSDGAMDIVRTPNKILNSWFSQMVENRTLRNFGMQFYDTTAGENGFVPSTVDPVPFGWYGVPGDPNKVIKRVDIPDLASNLDPMNFVIKMVESATAATSQIKGERQPGQITLGEIKLITDTALERITSMSKFYKASYHELGTKWLMLIEGQKDNLRAVKLSKKGFRGNYYEHEVKPSDWYSEAGYTIKVTSSAEQEKEQFDTIQKLNAVKAEFPGNEPLDKIYKKKLLELAKVTPDEMREVMDFEKQKAKISASGGGILDALKAAGGAGGGAPAAIAPGQPVAQPQPVAGVA